MDQNKAKVVHIQQGDWCKGCGICVYVCPKQVLTVTDGLVHISFPDKCIGCTLCEISCPDFVLEVY
jgi:2-oxoglutarate ferredoxin oxidoreductase subunit delta|nr:4Fe-4S binding protein [uncultured Sphaerochaeta sp.]